MYEFIKLIYRKIVPSIVFMAIFLFVFQHNSYAEKWEQHYIEENSFQVRLSEFNHCMWNGRLDVYFYFNNDPNDVFYYRLTNWGNPEIFTVNFKGKTGKNTVYVKYVVCNTPYGPSHVQQLDFTPKAIQPPKNVVATQNEINQITVSWNKATAYADADIEHQIYINNTLVKTETGEKRSCTLLREDHNFALGTSYKIGVKTVLKGTNRASATIEKYGKMFDFALSATKDVADKVTLRWTKNDNMPKGYSITRDNGTEVKEFKSHLNIGEDITGYTPGVYCTYTIKSLDFPNVISSAVGRKAPNGKISGTVTTPLNNPVGGVKIKVQRLNVSAQDTVKSYYETTTDMIEGRFEVDKIYYGSSESEFSITPELPNHKFKPDQLIRKLTAGSAPPEANVSFTDTTSLSIEGIVTQNGCPLEGVSVLALNETLPYETKADGTYSIVVSEPGNYTIQASKKGHKFKESYTSISILENTTGINFSDTSTVKVSGYFTASCNTKIGEATLKFSNSCINKTVTTDENAFYSVRLPLNTYNVELVDFTSLNEASLASKNVKDFFKDPIELNLDSISENGVTEHNFTYRIKPTISATFVNAAKTCDNDTLILEQGKTYKVGFSVKEVFNGNECDVDKGYIVLEHELSDESLRVDTIQFEGKIDTLKMEIGVPNIVWPYLNKFTATAYVGGLVSEPFNENIVITGHKPRESTFTTVSPQIPFLVLHDPPGDGSYSYFENSTTYTNAFSISASHTASAGINGQAKAGVELYKGQFVLSKTESFLEVSSSLSVSIGLSSESTWESELTIAKGYNTSSDDGIIGADGDIYIGGAMNLIYAVTDVIEYDLNEPCGFKKYKTLAFEPKDFATTFVYTESHINDVLIPELKKIRDLSSVNEKLKYDKEIKAWEQIVENNHKNIKNAEFKENISFSGGSEYSSSITRGSSFNQSITGSLTIENKNAINLVIEESGSGATVGTEFGVTIETGLNYSGSNSSSTTTGFTLTDDDSGDSQSVDILVDKVYGTPAFKRVAGTTSCPWEEGTLPREGVRLRSDKYYETVEESDGEAVFTLELANMSQSDEEQTYNLLFDATSNPQGAVITIGGSPVVGNVATPYKIPAGESKNATVTIKKAPTGYKYENLKFILKSGCDGSIKDEVLLNVEFKSDCGDISIAPTSLHPVISSSTEGNSIDIKLSDYNKDGLSVINIRAKTANSDWETIKSLNKSELEDNTTTVSVSFKDKTDGVYLIKAEANCSDATMHSEEFEVVVDRTAPVLTLLNPLDLGDLKSGDVIYAMFNEEVQMLVKSNITVVNKAGDNIPFQYGVSLQKIIILPDKSVLNNNDELTITIKNIKDKYGNTTAVSSSTKSTSSEISWTFKVPNVQSVFNSPIIDSDEDGIIDSKDNCIFGYNPQQEDADNDGEGDVCDNDIDGDGVPNDSDNCNYIANPDQKDTDNDGIGDTCDDDIDGDKIPNATDNCNKDANKKQNDTDLDGIGDTCDTDIDGDGVLNDNDNCPYKQNQDQSDSDNDGIGDVCDDTVTPVINNKVKEISVKCFPNPFVKNLTFYTESNKHVNGCIEIYTLGESKLMLSTDFNITNGSDKVEINTESLDSGIYFYVITIGNKTYSDKIIKK